MYGTSDQEGSTGLYGTSDQEGSTGLFVQIMTYKFGSKIEDVEDRLNEFLELVRRYDEANGADPVPDHVENGVHYFEHA